MAGNIQIQSAAANDADDIAAMVGELLSEIMQATGLQAFNFDRAETAKRFKAFVSRDKYFAFVARDDGGHAAGFVSIYESYALYAEGAFGTIAEFYVRASYRSNGVGHRLASRARSFAKSRGWPRLEVTTPPLPQFQRTLEFYERQGFSVTGGRKLNLMV